MRKRIVYIRCLLNRMPTLGYFLERTKQLGDSLLSLRFRPAGIFTNSIIKEPSITRLLRDAADHEQAMYKVSRPMAYSYFGESTGDRSSSGNYVVQTQLGAKPTRIDGKTCYVDYSFNDYVNLPAAKQEEGEEERYPGRTAVRIPEVIREGQSLNNDSLDISSSPKKETRVSLIPESVMQSDNINEICESILLLLKKYPNLMEGNAEFDESKLLHDIVLYHQEYKNLLVEMEDLEDMIAQQKEQLNYYNINLSEGSQNVSLQLVEGSDDLDIDQLLRKEEEEIEELEAMLSQK